MAAVAPNTSRILPDLTDTTDERKSLTSDHFPMLTLRPSRPSFPDPTPELETRIPNSVAPVAMPVTPEWVPLPAPAPRRSSPLLTIGIVVLGVLVGTASTAAFRTATSVVAHASHATAAMSAAGLPAPVASPAPAPAPAPPPSASAAPAPIAPVVDVSALPKPAPSPITVVTFPSNAAGHRVYVDGHLVGDGAKPVKLKCGHHTIKIGSHGASRSVDLPCGESITLN